MIKWPMSWRVPIGHQDKHILLHSADWNIQTGYLNKPNVFESADQELEIPFRTLVPGIRGGVSFKLDLQVDHCAFYKGLKNAFHVIFLARTLCTPQVSSHTFPVMMVSLQEKLPITKLVSLVLLYMQVKEAIQGVLKNFIWQNQRLDASRFNSTMISLCALAAKLLWWKSRLHAKSWNY